MKTADILINAGTLVTMNAVNEVLQDQAIVIAQGQIIDILPQSEAKANYQAKEALHLPQHILMPGLINTHTHLSMNLLRGIADDLALMDWLNHYIWPLEKKFVSPQFVKDGALLAIAEMIRGGITCLNDAYFYPEAVIEAAKIAGIRACISEVFLKLKGQNNQSLDASFDKMQQLLSLTETNDLIRPVLFAHAPYTLDIPALEAIAEFNQQHQLPLHAHLLESQSEIDDYLKHYGQRPLALWDDMGLINDKTLAVHMVYANDDDIALIKQRGASVSHCPESNMKLASGICPAQKMLHAGINVALGTDGAASNNDLDMFGEMRSAAFLGKVESKDPLCLDAATVLKMATINGAKALGIADQTGSLEIGKCADIVAVDMDTLETLPLYQPISQLVYATPRNQVTHVWVNGRLLLDNRKLTTLDEEALKATARKWQAKLKR